MGEIADYYVERFLDDRPHFGDEDDQPREVQCKKCGKTGLHWEGEEGVWVLCEKGHSVHRCSEKKIHKETANDFDNLDGEQND